MKQASRRPSPTRAYILRLWPERQAERDAPIIWRVSLQDARTQARRGFASLEEFFTYLESLCDQEEGG